MDIRISMDSGFVRGKKKNIIINIVSTIHIFKIEQQFCNRACALKDICGWLRFMTL
jgi:hypothetical protein